MFKNRICGFMFFAVLLAASSVQAAYLPVNDFTGNGAMASALNLTQLFTSGYDEYATDVNDSETSFGHASIQATTGLSGEHDWYMFSVGEANTKAFFDIDFTEGDLWSYIKLYDSKGNAVTDAFNGVGEMFDPGSQVPWDSFLSLTLELPGTYYLSVGRDNNQGLINGQGYTLHVGLSQYGSTATMNSSREPAVAATPIPAGIWLFGSALVALLSSLKTKKGENFKA